MHILRRHWLDYDPVALAVLVIGIGMIELLAWGIGNATDRMVRSAGTQSPLSRASARRIVTVAVIPRNDRDAGRDIGDPDADRHALR